MISFPKERVQFLRRTCNIFSISMVKKIALLLISLTEVFLSHMQNNYYSSNTTCTYISTHSAIVSITSKQGATLKYNRLKTLKRVSHFTYTLPSKSMGYSIFSQSFERKNSMKESLFYFDILRAVVDLFMVLLLSSNENSKNYYFVDFSELQNSTIN